MATITGSVLFDRDRSATRSSGDAGLPGIPVVLQNLDTGARCTVFTDQAGDYAFLHVPAGAYRLVQAPYETDGLPSPADFSGAVVGPVPVGGNPPIAAAPNPPAGATHLDAVTPNTRFLTVTGADIGEQTFLSGPVIYSPIETILDPCAAVSEENLLEAADRGTFGTFPPRDPRQHGRAHRTLSWGYTGFLIRPAQPRCLHPGRRRVHRSKSYDRCLEPADRRLVAGG